MTNQTNERIRNAARALQTALDDGESHEAAEMRIVREHAISDVDFPRVLECHATEYAIDDG